MGSFDGAEACELVVCYILSKLQGKYRKSIGLYRGDGLAASNCNPRQMENIKKQICEVFCDCGLRITVDANKNVVNFQDVTFDRQKNSYGHTSSQVTGSARPEVRRTAEPHGIAYPSSSPPPPPPSYSLTTLIITSLGTSGQRRTF